MNIFHIHQNPVIAAKAMTNKHIIKMTCESAQMLSTAHRILDGKFKIGLTKSGCKQQQWDHENINLYKATHVNHPSNVWVRESDSNYEWLYDHFIALSREYSSRYFGRVHGSAKLLAHSLSVPPKNINYGPMTRMPQAMPVCYHCKDSIEAYRAYYVSEKLKTDEDIERYCSVLKL